MSKDFSISAMLDLEPSEDSVKLILRNITNTGAAFFEEKGNFSENMSQENKISQEKALELIYGALFKDPFVGFAGIKIKISELDSFFYLTFRPIEQSSLSICLIPINFIFLKKDNIFIDKGFYIKIMADVCKDIHILDFYLDV